MKKAFISFIVIVFIASANYAQTLDWAKHIGGTTIYDVASGKSLKLDASGNIYVLGDFGDTVDFDPGPGVANLISGSNFIAKYDPSGNYIWSKHIGGTSQTWSQALTLDSLGNIYITGYFSSTIDLDPGPGVANFSPAGQEDLFFAKYDNAGNYIWARRVGGTGQDYSAGITLDRNSNVYITGHFEETVDFDPGAATHTLNTTGSANGFMAKYDAAGNYVWARQMGDWVNSLQLDNAGNIYCSGIFMGTSDFDPGTGVVNLSAAGVEDIFFAKYDNAGNYIYAKDIGGTNCDGDGNELRLDAMGNIYLAGSFYGTADFDPGTGTSNLTALGNEDIFIAKYTSSGNYLWAKRNGIASRYNQCFSMALDQNGNSYLTGRRYSGPGTTVLILKYDSTGNVLTTLDLGYGDYDSGNCLQLDQSGNMVLIGSFTGTLTFDPNVNMSSPNSVTPNMFLAKYSGIATGIKEQSVTQQTFKVYPNPNNGKTDLSFLLMSDSQVQVTVLNALGQEVATVENNKLSSGEHSYEIMTHSAGVYFLRITIDDVNYTKQIIHTE